MNTPKSDQPLDPLRRVFVYNGQQFHTTDGTYYKRDESGAIRRQIPKVKGKSARRRDKRERHIAKS